MPIIGRFKNLFRANTTTSAKRPLPDVIKYDVDPFAEWRVLGELGDGAFGMVQKVCSVHDDKVLAAAKCITMEDDETIEDMAVEIAILSSCDHPNVVGLLDAYFFENKLCMMLEFCAGGAIDNIMQELLKPLTEPQIAYITHYICEALSYMHSIHVIHRDLKAGNILLTADGVVKLADFGVSAKMKDAHERRSTFIGSPLLKSDPPKLDRPAKWTPFFNDFLEHCLRKNPTERCSAERLKTHPFVKDAHNPRPVIALLCEKNADVQEEILLADDAVSVDGSVGCSVLTGEGESSDEVSSKMSAAPIEIDAEAENRVPLREANGTPQTNGKQAARKKFAAPSPPEDEKEAIEILDDLYNALDNDYAEDASASTSTFGIPSQSSRNSTPQLQRTTLEIRAETSAPPAKLSPPKAHRHSSPASSDHQPTSSTHSSTSTAPSIQHQSNHSDSGVETHDPPSAVPPPPEPPIDYEQQAGKSKAAEQRLAARKHESAPVRRVSDESTPSAHEHPQSLPMSPVVNGRHKVAPAVVAQHQNGSLLSRSAPNRATVTRKTRTYVVDGVEMTSTSLHVLGAQHDYALRRKELQELKRLQRREARDQQLLNERNENDCEIQERKYNEYRNNIIRDYEAEREQLQKMHKKKMEELERIQEDERRALAKNIKNIQEKEYREFQIILRDEMKRLKYDVDMLPRAQRKDAYKQRREHLERVHADQDAKFVASKRSAGEKIKESMQRSHEDNLARLDRQFLNELHDLRRNVESALWEQERAQMSDRFNLRRQQLKDNFALQRSLMVTRHRMELEHLRKTHQSNEELLIRSLNASRKQLPKALRTESKTRTVIFRESLRINYPDESPHMWSQRIHDFEEGEKIRIKQKIEDMINGSSGS
ncbi:Protein kinase domain-containing protein [Aphelenchoides fujianensis]|nr:Protein kinase domain-containing protein [Aphelenchoides fujianensis]